jgi:hypothetical protein
MVEPITMFLIGKAIFAKAAVVHGAGAAGVGHSALASKIIAGCAATGTMVAIGALLAKAVENGLMSKQEATEYAKQINRRPESEKKAIRADLQSTLQRHGIY